jgi:hypothetical protein
MYSNNNSWCLHIVVWCGCRTWSVTVREENRLRVFENRALRRIFGRMREEVAGDWRRLHNGGPHKLYASLNIIRVIKSKMIKLAGHVARIGAIRNAYSILAGKPEGRRPLERRMCRWEVIIMMGLTEFGWEDVD